MGAASCASSGDARRAGVGFVDDAAGLRRRRIQGVSIVGGLEDIGWAIGRLAPDAVFVTIPDAPRERLDGVLEACRRAAIPCSFVRRDIELTQAVPLGAPPSEHGRISDAADAARDEPQRPRTLGGPARERLHLAVRPLRRRGLASRHAVAVHRRAAVHAARAVDRRDRASRPAWAVLHRRIDLLVRDGAVLADRRRAKAYDAVKYVDVIVMTSVVFPTYFLARLLVGRKAALLAAAGAAVIPSLAYSSYIVDETFAYPWAVLCFFLIAKALVTRNRRWWAGAVLASAFAPAVRGELAVIPAAVVLALIFAWWSSDRARE